MKHKVEYVFREKFHGVGLHGFLHYYENKEIKPWYTAYVELPKYKADLLEEKIDLINMPITCNKFASDVVVFEKNEIKYVKKFNKNYVIIGIDSLHSAESDFNDQISEGPEFLKKETKCLAFILDILLRHLNDSEKGLFKLKRMSDLTKDLFD